MKDIKRSVDAAHSTPATPAETEQQREGETCEEWIGRVGSAKVNTILREQYKKYNVAVSLVRPVSAPPPQPDNPGMQFWWDKWCSDEDISGELSFEMTFSFAEWFAQQCAEAGQQYLAPPPAYPAIRGTYGYIDPTAMPGWRPNPEPSDERASAASFDQWWEVEGGRVCVYKPREIAEEAWQARASLERRK